MRCRLVPGTSDSNPAITPICASRCDDVISAGSSVRATAAALSDAGASVAVVGAQFLLGRIGLDHFAGRSIPVESLGKREFTFVGPVELPALPGRSSGRGSTMSDTIIRLFNALAGWVAQLLADEFCLVGARLRLELLHAAVEDFSQIQIAFLIGGDGVRTVELTRLAA
jgi:hypothetical protein